MMTYDTVRRLMPVTFRAVSLRRADEETTPGVHCFNEIAVKDKPSYGSIDFAARCGTSPLFEPPQTTLIELKRLLARQRRQLVDDCAHIKNRSEYKEASSNVARKQILRLRFRPATERLGVAEHTFQEHSERHPADQVAFRIVFSMQAQFGRWFCNTAFFFCNAVQNSSQPICRHDPADRPEGAHLVAHAVQVICFGPGAPRVAMSGFLWRVAGDLATRENEAGSDASGALPETLSVSHVTFLV